MQHTFNVRTVLSALDAPDLQCSMSYSVVCLVHLGVCYPMGRWQQHRVEVELSGA
jgi:hypothetical protein